MKPIPLHIIVAGLKGMPLHLQIADLRKRLAVERPFSVRRNELESMLQGKLLKQLKKESRSAA